MLRQIIAASICVFLLSACGKTSLLGSRYDNFTAYYNKFYNAGKSFERGVEAVRETDRAIDWDRYLAVYPTPTTSGNRKEFEDAIKKSADVIRSHRNSKWVDDAVLLIGKSYFYQQNYVAAAQKFREAIDLETPLQDEGRFWLGRTLAANGALVEARDHLESSLQRESLDRRWEPAMWLALGDLRVRMQDWDGAAEALRNGAKEVRDREAAARAWFQLGQVEEERGDFAAAAAAFGMVPRLQPPYELDFAGRLSELRCAASIHGVTDALDGLRRLERDDKHRAKRADILFVQGLVLQEAGYPDDARETYEALLYESEFDVAAVRGRTHYQLGRLYRDDEIDFVLAAAHFDTAATVVKAPAQASAAEPLTAMAVADSRYQADIYKTYAGVYSNISRMDSLLHLATLPQDEFDTFVHNMRLQLAAELEAQRREEERQRDLEGFSDQLQEEAPQSAAASPEAAASATGGFLFHREPMRVQEGRQAFIRRWGDRPLVPGWRRRAAIDAYASGSRAAEIAERPTVLRPDPASVDAALPFVDVSAVPRSPEMRESMIAERALARYELGNVLFLSMELPDSAATWYELVIDENQDLPVAARAYYALAEVNRALGELDMADSLYRLVLQEHPGSELEPRVREHLGLDVDVAVDAAALVREEYEDALGVWRAGDRPLAYTRMLDIGLRNREDAVASAALMAAAQIGIEWAIHDSLSLFDPLPTSVSDSLLVTAGLHEAAEQQDSSTADVVGSTYLAIGHEETGSGVAVDDILSYLSEHLGSEPLGRQAQLLLAELESRRPAPEPSGDTLLAAAGDADLGLVAGGESADSLASPDGNAVDSTAAEGVMAATPFATEDASASADSSQSTEAFSLRGEGGIQMDAGGFTLQLAEFDERETAESALAELKAEGFRADVVERVTDGGITYVVCVGQFMQRGMAVVAARTGRGSLIEGASVVEVAALIDSP